MADEAMVRRVATQLDRVVGTVRLRRHPHLVRRARQSVQAWTAQNHGRVARDQRGEQELTNKPRYHDAVSRSQATAAGPSEELQSGKDGLSISRIALLINSRLAPR
jgi:hypothetical protein